MTAMVTALPGFLDVVGYGGDDVSFEVSLWSDTEHTVPVPIEGTSKAQVRRSKHDTEYWALTITVDEVDTNKAMIVASAASTAEMAELACAGSFYVGDELISGLMFMGYWDWQQADGGVKTYASGRFVLVAEVTR